MIRIPVRCEQCAMIAYYTRFDFAWATFCPWCCHGSMKYDPIRVDEPRQGQSS